MRQRKNRKGVSVPESNVSPGTVRKPSRKRPIIVAASILLALILVIGGGFYYQSYVAPFQRPVLTVDNTVIRMGYFLKRTKIAGIDLSSMLQQLAYEQIVKLKAPDFIVEPTADDIDNALLYMASSANTTAIAGENSTASTSANITESQFKEWYRQQLNQTGLSDAEYKDLLRTNLLASAFQDYLAARLPTTGEQVHLNVIVTANVSDANNAQARIKAGESFADVARQVSLDTQSKENGGDIGWIPHGIIFYDQTVFGLSVGVVSDPLASGPSTPDTSTYLLFMVSEKAASRQIDDNNMQILRASALKNWLTQEIPSHNIKIDYDFNSTENQAWINLQLTKLSK